MLIVHICPGHPVTGSDSTKDKTNASLEGLTFCHCNIGRRRLSAHVYELDCLSRHRRHLELRDILGFLEAEPCRIPATLAWLRVHAADVPRPEPEKRHGFHTESCHCHLSRLPRNDRIAAFARTS